MSKYGNKMSLLEADIKSKEVLSWLFDLDSVWNAEVCGSVRRRKATCNDLDVVVVTENGLIPNEVFKKENVRSIYKGSVKWTFVDYDGIQIDILSCQPHQLGSFMLHCTGSKWENIRLRNRANELGYSLSQYGLEIKPGFTISETEDAVYEALGLPFKYPSKR